jgi:glycosyltransferase involved in cell wall biosynthesis
MIDASLVIPTYNRIGRLKQVIVALEEQDYPLDRFEVVIISDGSSDGTDAYLGTLSTPFIVKPVFQNNQGPAAARNRGIELAEGPIVLFVDDDVVPAPQLVSEHLAWQREKGEMAIVIGPMLSPRGYRMQPWVRWEQALLARYYQSLQIGRYPPGPRLFYTGNASLARRWLVEVGGFDLAFRRGEDVELAYRLQDRGLGFYFNQNAIGYHYAERSFNAWLNAPYQYGQCDVIFTQQKGQTGLLPQLMKEFSWRNLFIRGLVRICLNRPYSTKACSAVLKSLIHLGDRLHADGMAYAACSGIYNLRYYQGVSDCLGGGQVFWEMIRSAGGK